MLPIISRSPSPSSPSLHTASTGQPPVGLGILDSDLPAELQDMVVAEAAFDPTKLTGLSATSQAGLERVNRAIERYLPENLRHQKNLLGVWLGFMKNVPEQMKEIYGKTAGILPPLDFSGPISAAMQHLHQLVAGVIDHAEKGQLKLMDSCFHEATEQAVALNVKMPNLQSIRHSGIFIAVRRKVWTAIQYAASGNPYTAKKLLDQAQIEANRAGIPLKTEHILKFAYKKLVLKFVDEAQTAHLQGQNKVRDTRFSTAVRKAREGQIDEPTRDPEWDRNQE